MGQVGGESVTESVTVVDLEDGVICGCSGLFLQEWCRHDGFRR